MATDVLSDAFVALDDRNLSGIMNSVGLTYEAEDVDETTVDQDTRIAKGGLFNVGASLEGFFDAAIESDLFDDVGVQDKLLTIAKGIAVGDVAYNFRALTGRLSPLQGSMGEIVGLVLDARASNALERGQVLFKDDSVTSTGSGSTLNAGAASTQIVGILHVYSASGTSPTLDVDIESDSSDDFTGSETTRISFTQATGRTAERKTAGSTADTWWRVNYTLGGTSPDFGFAVILILT